MPGQTVLAVEVHLPPPLARIVMRMAFGGWCGNGRCLMDYDVGHEVDESFCIGATGYWELAMEQPLYFNACRGASFGGHAMLADALGGPTGVAPDIMGLVAKVAQIEVLVAGVFAKAGEHVRIALVHRDAGMADTIVKRLHDDCRTTNGRLANIAHTIAFTSSQLRRLGLSAASRAAREHDFAELSRRVAAARANA